MTRPRTSIDPKVDPKADPRINPVDPLVDPVVDERRGYGVSVAMTLLLAVAVIGLIWMFAGPNQPVQNTAQIDQPAPVQEVIPQPVQPVQPAPEQPAQPEQPLPPVGNTTQP